MSALGRAEHPYGLLKTFRRRSQAYGRLFVDVSAHAFLDARSIGWGLGLGQLPDFYDFSDITGAANFYHFRANIAQKVYTVRAPQLLPARFTDARQLSRRAASYAAHTPKIVQRHCLSASLVSMRAKRHGSLVARCKPRDGPLVARCEPSHGPLVT